MTSYLMTSYDDILSQSWNDLKLSAHILATQTDIKTLSKQEGEKKNPDSHE